MSSASLRATSLQSLLVLKHFICSPVYCLPCMMLHICVQMCTCLTRVKLMLDKCRRKLLYAQQLLTMLWVSVGIVAVLQAAAEVTDLHAVPTSYVPVMKFQVLTALHAPV
jgi:hypothetical protein